MAQMTQITQMCAGDRKCAQVCAGMRRCAQVSYTGIIRHAQVRAGRYNFNYGTLRGGSLMLYMLYMLYILYMLYSTCAVEHFRKCTFLSIRVD